MTTKQENKLAALSDTQLQARYERLGKACKTVSGVLDKTQGAYERGLDIVADAFEDKSLRGRLKLAGAAAVGIAACVVFSVPVVAGGLLAGLVGGLLANVYGAIGLMELEHRQSACAEEIKAREDVKAGAARGAQSIEPPSKLAKMSMPKPGQPAAGAAPEAAAVQVRTPHTGTRPG